jgi:hypothetical protein
MLWNVGGLLIAAVYILGWTITSLGNTFTVGVQLVAVFAATTLISYVILTDQPRQPGRFSMMLYCIGCLWLIIGEGLVLQGISAFFTYIVLVTLLMFSGVILAYGLAWGFRRNARKEAVNIPTIPYG